MRVENYYERITLLNRKDDLLLNFDNKQEIVDYKSSLETSCILTKNYMLGVEVAEKRRAQSLSRKLTNFPAKIDTATLPDIQNFAAIKNATIIYYSHPTDVLLQDMTIATFSNVWIISPTTVIIHTLHFELMFFINP